MVATGTENKLDGGQTVQVGIVPLLFVRCEGPVVALILRVCGPIEYVIRSGKYRHPHQIGRE